MNFLLTSLGFISEKKKKEFDTSEYIVVKITLDNPTINQYILSINKIKAKCENYLYLFFRKFYDITLNEI